MAVYAFAISSDQNEIKNNNKIEIETKIKGGNIIKANIICEPEFDRWLNRFDLDFNGTEVAQVFSRQNASDYWIFESKTSQSNSNNLNLVGELKDH